jgi:hypothetical protein
MNKKIFSVLVFLASFVFFACRDKSDLNTFSEKDFAETIDLKGSIPPFDDTLMRPRNIHVVDNLLFLTNSRTEYIFEVYDLNTNKKINECIKFGNGPDEMIAPTIVNLTKDSLWIFDIQTWLLRNYRTKDFISVANPECVKNLKLGSSHAKATVLSNNRIVASISKTGEQKFDYYDLDGKLLDSKGEYTDNKLSAIENRMTYRFDYTTSLDDKIFASYIFGDIIEIYDGLTGDLIKRRYGPNESKPVLETVTNNGITASVGATETRLCYHAAPVRAGNEVFVLYFGGLYAEFKNTHKTKCTKMLVFDFEGNPLRIYNLDIPVIFFDVNAEKRIIYGVTDISDLDLPNVQSDYNIIKYEY